MTTQSAESNDILEAPEIGGAGVRVERNVELAGYTTMKVGGPADYFVTVHSPTQLIEVVRWAQSVRLPYFMLGGGSNMLISDKGIRGLVIVNRCRTVAIEPDAQDKPTQLYAESGAAMAGAARSSVRAGLTGLEWAVSVPGTIGGAVVGNAGAHGGEIKDNLLYARILDEQGQEARMINADFHYGYRESALKRRMPLQAGFKAVVLDALFALEPAEQSAVEERAAAYLAHRRQTQPVEPSLGSTFVNPPGDFAGRLIEAAGLKGSRVGGIEVSRTHANFLINPGGVGAGTASDVIRLIQKIERTVAAKFNVDLALEVQQVGEW